MAATDMEKTPLDDIPLSQEAGDGATSSTAAKGKLNSLKRFLRSSSSEVPVNLEENSDSKLKGTKSINLRFGIFNKRDASDDDVGSSKSKSSWMRIFKRMDNTNLTKSIEAAPTDADNAAIKQKPSDNNL